MRARKRYAAACATIIVVLTSVTGMSQGRAADEQARDVTATPSHEIVRELPELRTRTSRTYLTAEGGRLAELSTAPVNFREDGQWKLIDSTLASNADGVLRNRAGDYDVALPEDLGGTVRLSRGGRSVGFRFKDAAGERSASGPSAIYRAAKPGLDVRYDVLADGVKETLVLKDRGAPRQLRFALELSDGLRAVRTSDGDLEIRDGDGETRFAVPAPVAWDAAPGSTPSEAPVTMSYDPQASEIEMRVADDYLDDPQRKFPVSVDPWIVVQPPVRDCTLSARSGQEQTSFCGTDLMVGKVGGAEHRPVLHFDAVNQLPRHATVLNAYLKLHQKSQDGTAWEDWTVHGLTRPWANNEASWQNATTATAWTTLGGDFSPALDPVKRLGGGGGGIDTFWPVDEQIAAYADGTASDHGLLIKSPSADPATGLVFASGEDPDPAKRPKLSIYYEPIMGTDGPFSFVYENLGNTQSGVNVASGRLTVTDTDATVDAGPPAFDLQRHYNSADERSNKLGLAWRLEAYAKLEVEAHATIVHMPSGTALRFRRNADNTYAPARGSDAQLTETAAGHVLQLEGERERLHFDGNGRLVKREDIATGQHVAYAYNSQGRIATITDAAQGVTTVNYDPTWGIVSSISLPDGRTITYDVRSNFLRSRTVDGATSNYTYDASGRLSRLTSPSGSIKFAFDSASRVTAMTRVTDAAADTGPTTTFTYGLPGTLCDTGAKTQTVVTYPEGYSQTLCFDAALRVQRLPGEETPDKLETDPGDSFGNELLPPRAAKGCVSDPTINGYCGADDVTSEPGDSSGFSALATTTNLTVNQYGVADQNRSFDIFSVDLFKKLSPKFVRRVVPWNVALPATYNRGDRYREEFDSARLFVARALQQGKEPVISFERCTGTFVRNDTSVSDNGTTYDCGYTKNADGEVTNAASVRPPTQNEYAAAVQQFLSTDLDGDNATYDLENVDYFTAWNEPNLRNYQPVWDNPALAGKYWNSLNYRCRSSAFDCRVAAGDFIDSRMANANDSSTAGGKYFDAYQAALSHEPRRWAWHAYKDGEETYAKSTASTPDYAGYWRRTKGFLRATAGQPVWLTEQGVVRFRSGVELPANDTAVANAMMRLYVDDERALTELDSRINMFNYYQWRGDEVGKQNRYDSGLVSTESGRTRDVYCIYRRKTNPSQPAC